MTVPDPSRDHQEPAMFTTVPLKSVSGLDTAVKDVMHGGFVALPATATLADAAAAMYENGVHAVLIQTADRRRLGWVTSRGILHNHAREWTAAATAAEAITEPAASVAPTATLSRALDLFIGTGASHVLVATGEHEDPIGVIAESDLVAFMARRA
jgi:CBS domain-containing protein